MVLLLVLTLALSFHLSSSDSSSCLLDNPSDDCLGFTATNDTILTTSDSCKAPPNRNVTVLPCGPEGISPEDCDKAGCCFKKGECYNPLVEKKVDYKFYQAGRRYKEAYRECRTAGWYKLPCVAEEFDFRRLKSRACGNVWLGQTLIDRPTAPQAPFYNRTTGTCSTKVGVSCRLSARLEYAQTLELAPNNSFVLSIVNPTEKRPFLCIKEEWKPHVKTYPYHVSSADRIKIMLCGLIFSGNVETQKPSLEWKGHFPNGTTVRLKAKNYTEIKQVSAQYYADSVRADQPGKYECIFSFLDQEGSQTSISGWAYHYTPTSCHVVAQGAEYSNRSVIELQAGHSSHINITVVCSGYPLPKVHWTLDVNGKGPVVKPAAESGVPLNISKFESLALLNEDITYTVNLQPKSDITSFPNTTIRITKLPAPTSCNFLLYHYVTVNGTATKTLMKEHSRWNVQEFHEANKSSFAHQAFELDVNCTGFPSPNLTAIILTEKEDSEPSEKVMKPVREHFSWKLKSFASEASVAQDYSKTLTLRVESADHPPVKMVLRLVKTIIKFDMEIPAAVLTAGAPEVTLENGTVAEPITKRVISLPCKGASGPDFPTPSAFWEFNGKILDLDSKMGQYIVYKYPEKSKTDSAIDITSHSSIVAGEYKCTIMIDNNFAENYTTKVTVRLPPTPPGPTLVTEIVGTEEVRAGSVLPSSYQYLGNISITGFLFSGNSVLQEISETITYNNTVHGTFTVPSGSGAIQTAFKASNKYGSSELSRKSDPLEIFPETPRSSVTGIKRNKAKQSNTARTLSLTFNEVPDVDGYEVRLHGTPGKVYNITDNEIVIEELEPETSYILNVRGVSTVGGERFYGPNSLTATFTTAPEELPAPADLQGQPLESEGNKSAVLLTWSAPKVSAEFIDGYKLNIVLAGESEESNESTRRKRQALQTFKTVYIPFAARAKVIKGLDGGTTYEFELKSYSSNFGESEPAKVTVQTLTAGPCPFSKPELYPPRYCPPRVSLDRAYLYIKFYFDCYTGEGRDFRGKHSTTHRGECVPWTEEHLSQFSAKKLPEVGTNYCRNIENSWKDSTTLHDKPWCYLADGSNETCSLRPCHNEVDETCYLGNGTTYRGAGYNEQCAPWSEKNLQEHPGFPEEILGSKACRNWEGSNMTQPWCFTPDGDRAECSVPPCGESTVTFQSGENKTTNYTVSNNRDHVCIKLDETDKVKVGVRHSFRRENCHSDTIFPKVVIPAKIKWTDRLWARYILVEVILMVLFISLWSLVLCRKRVITRQSSMKTGSSLSKKGTTSTRLSQGSSTR